MSEQVVLIIIGGVIMGFGLALSRWVLLVLGFIVLAAASMMGQTP